MAQTLTLTASKGFGPKTALKLIKQYGTIENALPHIENVTFADKLAQIREIFLHPKVTDNYKLEWKEPNETGLNGVLCVAKKSSVRNASKNPLNG